MSRSIIFAVIFLALIVILVPFAFSKQTNESLSVGVDFVASFASLLTLLIALRLFNKYGIETTLLERQTKAVFELLEDLNKATLIISGDSATMRFSLLKPYMQFYEEFYSYELFFSSTYIDGLENIWRHSNDIFLPVEIASKLKNQEVYVISHLKKEVEKNEFKVLVPAKTAEFEGYGKINQKDSFTLLDFVADWSSLIEEANRWINKNSTLKSKLNL
jgi:hypothetical protein